MVRKEAWICGRVDSNLEIVDVETTSSHTEATDFIVEGRTGGPSGEKVASLAINQHDLDRPVSGYTHLLKSVVLRTTAKVTYLADTLSRYAG